LLLELPRYERIINGPLFMALMPEELI